MGIDLERKSGESGKYEEVIRYYKKTGEANPFISVEGLISEAKPKSWKEEEKVEAGRRAKEETYKRKIRAEV